MIIIITLLTHKEHETSQDSVGKMIHKVLCQKIKFDHANKWYRHNPESVLENATHNILGDSEKQKDYLISARQPGQVFVNKKR